MRLRPFSLALASPLETARGSIDRREGFLVAVDPGADGESVPAPGLGEATPLPGWTESRSACEAALRGAEDENDGKALATDALDRLDPTETPAARHGLALALADATARDAGQSLAERLAENENLPAPTETVPVNATIGDVDSEDTVAAAENAVEKGFDCLKVKVGARGLDADIERLRAVRRAVGGDVSLRADANGAWDRETAREAVERLAPLDLAYLEQPLPADDLDGAAALRTVGSGVDTDTDRDPPVPIALDESLATRGLDAVLDADAADAVVLKPMALGGPDRALAAARRAREAGVEPVVTTTIDAVVARTAAVHVAAAIPDVSPCGLATGSLLDTDLAPDPCPISDGAVTVPTDPGLAGDAFDDLL
ncbi:mandelate racemase/muconate lactonizing enzyme family protein [Halorubrum lacusprofundi]|jgi:L-alanine-DL-glutamate epimerase-like enolase superfamily enzyme|uniref:o-succinylbenzoate synthase n=1 Tax=Halorubrum lacusprofundi (strain ATCC 49239 / DSM 5036 / JCM 8891 / ACAM 34) TaxID=416348 RepID=B9LN30_HALLT|nr:o-succinylbenzoate synthase [Halorubrum lacusprofundi]ACM56768.1 Mandelate racemase/muconate lactonizing protein [Halorubrum lacusprofundi ATCC 49239]MCG1007751.1 o-succinylbenzoate synthase [Halorubrum lacusprofundi]